MEIQYRLRPCPCGQQAVWHRDAPDPEQASEHAVCFLTDADFADDYCEACFTRFCQAEAMTPSERAAWQRVPSAAE
jgi:hypothetical protein